MTCDEQKKIQLGMSIGAAQHRLRTKLMFSLAVKCGLDICYRCGLRIGSEEDFSIDHKEPWLGNDTNLFWDLGNVAFSHRGCNYSDRRACLDRSGLKKVLTMNKGPEGTLWCGGHREYLPVTSFSRNRSRWSGHQDTCKECRSKKRRRPKGGR